jgi:hypothetical protein
MFTNGLSYWAEDVPGSLVERPFHIEDIILSANT